MLEYCWGELFGEGVLYFWLIWIKSYCGVMGQGSLWKHSAAFLFKHQQQGLHKSWNWYWWHHSDCTVVIPLQCLVWSMCHLWLFVTCCHPELICPGQVNLQLPDFHTVFWRSLWISSQDKHQPGWGLLGIAQSVSWSLLLCSWHPLLLPAGFATAGGKWKGRLILLSEF